MAREMASFQLWVPRQQSCSIRNRAELTDKWPFVHVPGYACSHAPYDETKEVFSAHCVSAPGAIQTGSVGRNPTSSATRSRQPANPTPLR
ncbi:hypothetical protein SAMN04488498_1686 [Mesorhizobium albiziae]|uniref:Uncharacterized protein n=1 Tax=Neomesorhizobium albiziae TaxID=335020 RepID=A0A1I4FYW1_9HYPH|nr:hypothetical protein GCM10007937_43180 [Mesorhizobium albiziae]SFL23045.1 hypothetical protein SAMN04488498_1686 [Mesorhizobium albiziae]